MITLFKIHVHNINVPPRHIRRFIPRRQRHLHHRLHRLITDLANFRLHQLQLLFPILVIRLIFQEGLEIGLGIENSVGATAGLPTSEIGLVVLRIVF